MPEITLAKYQVLASIEVKGIPVSADETTQEELTFFIQQFDPPVVGRTVRIIPRFVVGDEQSVEVPADTDPQARERGDTDAKFARAVELLQLPNSNADPEFWYAERRGQAIALIREFWDARSTD